MRTLDEIQSSKLLSSVNILNNDQKSGYARIKLVRWEGTVIFDESATPWEHVSVCPFKKAIIPTWYELKTIKEIFWNDDEEVIQFFPKKSDHVNIMTNCLHLWRNKDVEKFCDQVGYRGV